MTGSDNRNRRRHRTLDTLIRAGVTLVLLGIVLWGDLPQGGATVIIGAVVGYWLRESEQRGREAVTNRRRSREASHGDEGTGQAREAPA